MRKSPTPPQETHVETWDDAALAWKLALEIGDTIMALQISRRYRAGVHEKYLGKGYCVYNVYLVDRFPNEPPIPELAAYYIRTG